MIQKQEFSNQTINQFLLALIFFPIWLINHSNPHVNHIHLADTKELQVLTPDDN